ncbi:MAG TPA: serine hydrolase domain-containing protein [Vicinamibacterales bacterium]|nr:serine hydrolase domain-containing protein [Vicinamibacterales bacterium]
MRGYLVVLAAALGVACGQDAAPTAPSPVIAAAAGDLKSTLATAFDALPIPGTAGCSISISQHGQVVLEHGRGQVAPGRPASADSLYRIASLTKPITASTVLISEQAGRLSRTDKIGRFLAYAEPAPTIDELIKHIPGLSNYTSSAAYAGGNTGPTTVEGLLALIQPWDGVRRNQYSNSHYALLGAVLQQVNARRYEEVVQRDIFGPAGMSRSSFAMPPESESAGFPVPSRTHPTWAYAAGAVTSTAADLNRFNQALLSNRFGFGAVESFDRSAGVTSFGMGSSLVNGDLRFTHSGGIDTYSSYSAIFPADRSSVVVLCNFSSNGLQNLILGPGGIRSLMLGR